VFTESIEDRPLYSTRELVTIDVGQWCPTREGERHVGQVECCARESGEGPHNRAGGRDRGSRLSTVRGARPRRPRPEGHRPCASHAERESSEAPEEVVRCRDTVIRPCPALHLKKGGKMIAAIYARKSTGQHVADDAKSVVRQIANAKAFALAQGWTVKDEHI